MTAFSLLLLNLNDSENMTNAIAEHGLEQSAQRTFPKFQTVQRGYVRHSQR